jgi:hypothetical protein
MLICLALAVVICGTSQAAELREIVLTDGTVIIGEIVSVSGGKFTIQTQSFGVVEVPEGNIREVLLKSEATPLPASRAPASPPPQTESRTPDFRSMHQSIFMMSGLMELIFSLQDDPHLKRIMNDPKVVEAMNQGDLSRVLDHPEMREFLKSPRMRSLTQSLSGMMAGNPSPAE